MNAVDTSFRAIIRVVGDVPDSERQYALDKTAALGRFAGAPVLGAHVTTWAGRRGRLAAVEVEIDVDGDPVRARAEAPSLTEAVDLVHDRLRARLTRHAERRPAPRRRRDTIRKPAARALPVAVPLAAADGMYLMTESAETGAYVCRPVSGAEADETRPDRDRT
jgi:ribosome-associated translation inhibitor RaiA